MSKNKNNKSKSKPKKKPEPIKPHVLSIVFDETDTPESVIRADVANLDQLIQTIASPTAQPNAVLDALHRIARFSLVPDLGISQRVLDANGVEPLVKIILTNTTFHNNIDATIVYEAISVIVDIVCDVAGTVPLIMTTGIVPVLIKYVAHNNLPDELKDQSVLLFGNLAGQSLTVRDTLHELGILDAICKFTSPSLPLGLLRSISRTICALTHWVDDQYPPPFPSSMKTSIPALQNLLLSCDPVITSLVTNTLWCLVEGNDKCNHDDQINLFLALAKPKIFPILIDLLTITSYEHQTHCRVILIFETILQHSKPLPIINSLLLTPLVPTLLPVLHSTLSPSVRTNGIYLLSKIATSNAANASKLMEWGLYTELWHLDQRFTLEEDKDNVDVQKTKNEICRLLYHAARHCTGTILNHLKSVGWIQSFVAKLTRDTDMTNLVLSLTILSYFLRYGSNNLEERTVGGKTTSVNVFAAIAQEAGIEELMADLLNHSDIDVKKGASILLTDYYDFIIEED